MNPQRNVNRKKKVKPGLELTGSQLPEPIPAGVSLPLCVGAPAVNSELLFILYRLTDEAN